MNEIDLNDYDYDLPDEKIAQYPVAERDGSKLLVYKNSVISSDYFRNIDQYIQGDSLLVFNNTRVIRARLLFRKRSGSPVEVFCLEPLFPSAYELSFGSKGPVEWKCLVGNLKKWKNGILTLNSMTKGSDVILSAENLGADNEACRIRFSWNNSNLSFSDVLEGAGHMPLPPYIKRNDEEDDNKRYQTVYSTVKGSVAAPTAGLHFTENVMRRLTDKGVKLAELTLHVGAGTFKPVKADDISGHEMHCEHFFVTADTIKALIENYGRIIAVGTTTVRTLESLYWLGAQASPGRLPGSDELSVDQWEPYLKGNSLPVKDSLAALCEMMARRKAGIVNASTSIMIMPGYNFRMIDGLITNFHQPKSTLLLLISAWTGENWKKIYRHALENNFRFLSYGDSSLLFR